MKRKSILSLKRKRGLKFRALRKGDSLFRANLTDQDYLAVVDEQGSVVAYIDPDFLFDEHGNYFKESW